MGEHTKADDTAPLDQGEPHADDERSGSQTGTIGGGGPDAHNPDPVRATGVDDPTAGSSRSRTKGGGGN